MTFNEFKLLVLRAILNPEEYTDCIHAIRRALTEIQGNFPADVIMMKAYNIYMEINGYSDIDL